MLGSVARIDENVVKLDEYESVEEIPEYVINETLKHGGGVCEAKGHD